jgi:hypothetical protein
VSPVRLRAKGDLPLERRLLRYEQLRLVLLSVATVAVLGGLVVLIIGVSLLITDSKQADVDREQLGVVADRVLSCTERGEPEAGVPADEWQRPPGDCYIDAQRAQAQVIGQPAGGINTTVVAAAACASTLPNEMPRAEAQRRTLACTIASLKEISGQ